MKYTLLFFFMFFNSFEPIETNVYICGSKGAKKYHLKENCRGLSACSHGVVKTSIKQAQNLGLTICGWED